MGNSTLAGFLQSNTVRVTTSQLLNLVNNPLVLIGAPPSGFANLLRSLIVSLEFGSTAYVGSFPFTGACVFYGGPSRLSVCGGGGINGPGSALLGGPAYPATSVSAASGGNTVYSANLRGAPTNMFVGYEAIASEFSHGVNDGTFQVIANTANSVTLANGAGVVDTTGLIVISFPANVWGAGVGGPNDLAGPLLVSAATSCIYQLPIQPWAFPSSEIAGAPIFLGNPLPLLGNPQNFTAGDSSLLITAESLQVQL